MDCVDYQLPISDLKELIQIEANWYNFINKTILKILNVHISIGIY